MANGGGPACLRLRVVADPATIDPRFLMSPAALDRIAGVVDAEWPETIAPREIGDPALIKRIERAQSEEGRVGKESVRTCKSRGSPSDGKKTTKKKNEISNSNI